MNAPAVDITLYEAELDTRVGAVLDTIEAAAGAGVELDPLASILRCMRDRGAQVDLAAMPPMMQMLLGGMIE